MPVYKAPKDMQVSLDVPEQKLNLSNAESGSITITPDAWVADYPDFEVSTLEEIRTAIEIAELTVAKTFAAIEVRFGIVLPPCARAVVFVDDKPFLLNAVIYNTFPKNYKDYPFPKDIRFNLYDVPAGTKLSFRCTVPTLEVTCWWREI